MRLKINKLCYNFTQWCDYEPACGLSTFGASKTQLHKSRKITCKISIMMVMKIVAKLDSDGDDRDRRRTLMLTPMCCWGGLFLLSYLYLLIKLNWNIRSFQSTYYHVSKCQVFLCRFCLLENCKYIKHSLYLITLFFLLPMMVSIFWCSKDLFY